MPHTVTFVPEANYVETKAWGNLDWAAARELVTEIVKVGKESGCFFCFSDYREAKINLSTTEIYSLPQLVSDTAAQVGISPNIFKRAVVAKSDISDYRFFETVTLNQGQKIKIFTDIEQAKKWLLDK